MNEMVAVVLTILFIAFVAFLIIKKYDSVFVFLLSGMCVLLIYSLVTGTSVLADDTTGNSIVDVFVFATNTFKAQASGVGMTLMMVTGYAVYMSHIGASTKLAYLAMKPLSRIKNPYIILSLVFVIGTFLKMVITSHAGLVTLLMAIAFPILTSLGISRLSVITALVMCGFLDWGPNDSSAIFAAENVCDMSMIDYLLSYQGRLGLVLIVICAIFLPIYLKYMDKKTLKSGAEEPEAPKPEDVACPAFYAILPVVPLVLITVSNFLPSIKLDVVTANFVSMILVLVLELFRRKDRKAVTKDFPVILKAMGNSFVNVVSILIGAAVFAKAVTTLGGITILSNKLASISSATLITVTLMSLITFLAGTLLGSGNASWFAFGPLVPDITTQMGVSAATVALPMQLAPAMGRCMSPVAGVIISASGMTGIDSIEIVKRTTVPSIFMFICTVLLSQLFV